MCISIYHALKGIFGQLNARAMAPVAVSLPSRAQRSLTLRASTSELTIEQGMERLRLHNLSPQPGSRKAKKRKGRGHSAGQVGGAGDERKSAEFEVARRRTAMPAGQ